jgi:DNA-binding SARP family transcriptional activator
MRSVEFRLLGPLEVIGPRGSIGISSQRQRTILARLVLERGRTVSRDRLVDDVWGDEPPATARHAIDVHVGGLRRLLGANRIESQPGGFRLSLAGIETDLDRFEALTTSAARALEAGNPKAAAADYDSALALWRGPALVDLDADRLVRDRNRLDEQRLRTTELWVDAELAAGHHADLVPVLGRMVADEPLREELRVRLMLALYRAGRQAEALATYHEARALLDRELGVEPGPALEAAQRAVLTHDPSLLAAPTAPAAESHALDVVPATPLAPSRARGRRTVVALAVELTATLSRDPEAVEQPLRRAEAVVQAAIAAHGGTVVEEGTTGLFGVEGAHEDDALRAVLAAERIRTELAPTGTAATDTGVAIRAAIVSGDVVLERITTGGRDAGVRSATRDVVGAAGRLAATAPLGEILLSGPVFQLVRSSVVAEVSGTPTIQRLVRLALGARDRPTRLEALFVGRERELTLLRTAFDQAVDERSCRLVSLLGLAGIGKSRLVHEFLAGIRTSALVAHGRCLPYGEGVVWWPLAEAVRQSVGLGDAVPPEEVLVAVRGQLADEPRGALIGERVSTAIGLIEATGSTVETSWAIRRFFEHVARETPLVLVFDDVQWADPQFLDLLDYVAETARDAPILLLCIARPELLDERPAWGGGKLNATSILLGALGDADIARIVGSVLGSEALPAVSLTRVVAAAEGNPLFAEEWVAMLRDDGLLRMSGAGWELTADASALPTPPSITALLTARLDRLPEPEQRAIGFAAVIGKTFTAEAVEALSGVDGREYDTERALVGLVRRELIRPDPPASGLQDAYRFKHILIRDAAYGRLPKRTRAELHERLADLLERDDATGAFVDEQAGNHLELAYQLRVEVDGASASTARLASAASARLAAAGRDAMTRGDAALSAALLQRALRLPAEGGDRRGELLALLGEAQLQLARLAEALETFRELEALAVRVGSERLRWHATLGAEMVHDEQGQATPVEREHAETALRVFEAAGDIGGRLTALHRLGALSTYTGTFAEGARVWQQAARVARKAGRLHEEERARRNAVGCQILGMTPVAEALANAHALRDWARANELIVAEVITLSQVGRLKAMQGAFDEGRDLVSSAIALMNDLNPGGIFFSSPWLQTVELMAGDRAALERILRRGLADAERLGVWRWSAYFALDLSRILLADGAIDEAEALVALADRVSPPWMTRIAAWTQSCRAAVFAYRGDLLAAASLSAAAVSSMDGSDFVMPLADCLAGHAVILEQVGRVPEAASFWERAATVWDRKGVPLLASRLRARTPWWIDNSELASTMS